MPTYFQRPENALKRANGKYLWSKMSLSVCFIHSFVYINNYNVKVHAVYYVQADMHRAMHSIRGVRFARPTVCLCM